MGAAVSASQSLFLRECESLSSDSFSVVVCFLYGTDITVIVNRVQNKPVFLLQCVCFIYCVSVVISAGARVATLLVRVIITASKSARLATRIGDRDRTSKLIIMKISDMTIAQLRRALRERVLSAEGSKADLEIRLRADLEEDPDHLNKDEYEYEDAVSGELKLLLSAQSEQFNSRIENIAAQLLEQVNSRITAQSEQITAESEKVNSRITAQSELITAQSEKLRSNIKEVFEDLSNDISELINRVDKVYKPNCNEVQGAASDLKYKAEGQTT